jgi:hypothetical protein
MKTKLLKKLHKEYDWYFNSDGFPVLINHVKQSVIVYDVECLCQRMKYKVEDLPTLVKVPHTEWALRMMKLDILLEYGWDMSRVRYKQAIKRFKQKRNK